MKILLTILILIVLGGLGWYLYTNSNVEIVDDGVMEEEMSETDGENMEGDTTDHDAMEEGNTDAGMEFPTVDADISLDAEAEVFEITGSNFAFSQSEIRVKEGDVVTINFESTDGFHDWVVDEFNAATAKVNTDGTTSVTFVADKKGTYEYYCSVGNHRAQGMVGTLVVE